MGRNLTDNIERGCVGLCRRFGKVWWYMNSTEISSRAVRNLLHCKIPRGWAVQEDRMRPRRARVTCIFAGTVAPEEETFWALQGLSVRGGVGDKDFSQ
jgi:hypothetical protein